MSSGTPRPLLLVVNGKKPDDIVQRHGSFESQIRAILKRHAKDAAVSDIPIVTVLAYDNQPLPEDVTQFTAVIMSGSVHDVTDGAPWMLAMAEWLRRHVTKVPMLGICFGHQMLALALGGDSGPNPRRAEVGVFRVRVKEDTDKGGDPLVQDLPTAFDGVMLHAQSVLRLPPGAVALYETDDDYHQIVKFASMTYGTQFHPEYTVDFAKDLTPRLSYASSDDVQRLSSAPHACPEAESVVARFVALCLASRL